VTVADAISLRLGRLDSCAVSDALDKLGLSGAVTGLQNLSTVRRIAGRVRTVKLVAAEQPRAIGGPPKHLGASAIEAAAAGEIIVMEQRTGRDAACWGGLLSLAARLRGVAGVIAEGPVRDVDDARRVDLPVFARSATARTARGRVAEAGTDVEILVGEVTVNAGDYVIADASGVVFIRRADAETVLAEAERIFAREAAMAQDIMRGQPVGQVMGASYEHMLKG
jgi:regulator of RNase E activity RraA